MEKIVSSKVLFTGRRFIVKELTVEVESGKTAKFEIVEKGGNSVAMVPIDTERNVILVEEYFAATNERALCLPKGGVDPGENPEEAALRELQEEVGLKGKMTYLVTMSVSPGYLTQKTIVFLATDLEKSKLEHEETHYLNAVRLPLEDAIKKILKGEITEARTIGGLTLAKLYLEQK
jgi:8-oxo-dGTP pyrophosphatase MutT (NUDIX family)